MQPGVNYDCRVRSVNNLGVRSVWQSLFGFTVDSSSGATIKIDYGFITDVVSESIDYELITGDSSGDETDWGFIGQVPSVFSDDFSDDFR